jgi:hypothetical protein
MKQILFITILFLGISLTSITCKDVGVQPQDKTFTLTVDDASCTEVYLSLKIGIGISSRTVTLKRDTITLFTKTIDAAETTITDTNLLPNHTYNYTAQLLNSSLTSNSTARTMDTTSHAWSFTTTLLGDGSSSSVLYDVAIVSTDPPLAYAVGKIYRNDTVFNAAKWDGQQWELKMITVNYNSNWISPPLNGVFAFSATDIWFSSGVPIHGDGNVWTQYHLFDMGVLTQSDGSINKIWGSNSSNDIYFVGNKGTIVHYANGSTWTKIESGTSLSFYDIFGSGGEILAVCSQNYPFGEGIYNITGNTAQEISSHPIEQHELFGIWFVSKKHYYIVGDGNYEKHSLSDNNWKNGPLDFTTHTTSEVRGNGTNDVFIVGAFGECLHWNGVSGKSFIGQTGLAGGSYTSVAVKGNLVVAAGYNAPQAAITVGTRQ